MRRELGLACPLRQGWLVTPNHGSEAPALSPFRELTLKQHPRIMRHSPTESEAALWRLLKGQRLAISFKRQVPLVGYIVDFYASEARLIVEVDGGYHAERVGLDAKRQRRLERAGYRVVRVSSELVGESRRAVVALIVSTLRH